VGALGPRERMKRLRVSSFQAKSKEKGMPRSSYDEVVGGDLCVLSVCAFVCFI
jgi:hypothetical protein